MRVKIQTLLLLAILSSSCAPPRVVPETKKVRDNQIVFVQNKNFVGAFRLFEQIQNPETAKYEWELFELNQRAGEITKIGSGTGFAGHDPIGFFSWYNDVPIEFGPFKYRWSVNTKSKGFVYFISRDAGNEQSYCISSGYRKHTTEELFRECSFKIMPIR